MPAPATSAVLNDQIVDDIFVGVSALSADGAESLVTFGGRAARLSRPAAAPAPAQ